MSTQPDEPPPNVDDDLPGTEPAWEPATLVNHPLRAQDVAALLPKDIG
jgi:hypothetical protein